MKRRECVALLGATVVCCHGVEELGNIQSGQLGVGPAPRHSERTTTRLAHLAETGCGVLPQHSPIALHPMAYQATPYG